MKKSDGILPVTIWSIAM